MRTSAILLLCAATGGCATYSPAAVSREAGSSIYVATKAGIQGLSEALREEVAEKDIKVGLIESGFTGADLQYPDFPPEKQRDPSVQDASRGGHSMRRSIIC